MSTREIGELKPFGWLRRRRRKSSSERLPWYRAPDYSGNLTEAEKRQLDAFRMLASHPAHQYSAFPDHVNSYISGLELEAHDLKDSQAVGRALGWSSFGAFVLYANHFGLGPLDSIWRYFEGLMLIVLPWIFYRSEWRKNKDSFWQRRENILKEWELDYIANIHLAAKRGASDPPPI